MADFSIGGSTSIQAPAAQNPLNVKAGESILDYETRLGSTNAGPGTGFGTPAPAFKDLAAKAAPAATAPSDGSSAPNPNDDTARSLGYKDYADAVSQLTAPSDDTTKFYNDAYSAAGLSDLHSKITSRQNDLNTALGSINDNPWLDEASRVGRSRNLQTLANADIKNWQSDYNTKLKGVHDLVTEHSADLNRTSASNKAKLAFLEAQAKATAAATAAKTKADNAAPKTIKGANGATFQYNPATGIFDQILPGKAPKGSTPASPKDFQLTPKQLTSLQSQGLDSNSANGILSDIKAGHDLESIRQQMTANGINPGLLDNLMLYVDPAHNTPSKSKASGGRTL